MYREDNPTDTTAVRLTFHYEDGKVTLKSRQVVAMRVPVSDRTDEYQGQSGSWVELHDDKKQVRYRRVVHDLMPSYLEAPSGDPARTFTRVPAKARGAFSIVVPDLGPQARVLLFASVGVGATAKSTREGPGEAPHRAAQCVAEVRLHEELK